MLLFQYVAAYYVLQGTQRHIEKSYQNLYCTLSSRLIELLNYNNDQSNGLTGFFKNIGMGEAHENYRNFPNPIPIFLKNSFFLYRGEAVQNYCISTMHDTKKRNPTMVTSKTIVFLQCTIQKKEIQPW